MKHGLLSREILVPGEDEAALKELSELLRAEVRPVGELEGLLFNRIVAATWRLRRLERVEAGIFTWEHYGELSERAQQETSSLVQAYQNPFRAASEPTTVTDPQKYKEAFFRVRGMRIKREGAESAALGRPCIWDADKANAFSKPSRYQTAIERSLYKTMHELQRLRAKRRSEGNFPPPVPVDVDVSRVFWVDFSKWLCFVKGEFRPIVNSAPFLAGDAIVKAQVGLRAA